MIKIIRLSVVAVTACALLASCNEDGSADVREDARQAIENSTAAVAGAANDVTNAANNAVEAAVPSGPTTVMEFSETTYDFGNIVEGEKVTHTYSFQNDGDEPLIISNAKGSCGCTVPQWPREPIPVGGSGEIVVEFNSTGKTGSQNKKVTINANTNPAQTVIYLKGDVAKKDAESPLVQ